MVETSDAGDTEWPSASPRSESQRPPGARGYQSAASRRASHYDAGVHRSTFRYRAGGSFARIPPGCGGAPVYGADGTLFKRHFASRYEVARDRLLAQRCRL